MTMLILTVLTLLTATPGARDEVEDKREVAAVIRNAVEGVVSVLKDGELSRKEKREGAMKIIDPLIDYRLLAMLTLGRTHWGQIDDKQRESFTDLFIETIQLSYIEKLELFTDEVVEYEKPVAMSTKGAPKYNILTYIVSKGDRTKVAYQLTRRDGVWKVFDFEIEGVSVRKSYGSQYNDFLREDSFEQLLETMREKVKVAKEKISEPGTDDGN